MVVLIATASMFLVACSRGDGATSVSAGQRSPTSDLPTTTTPDQDEEESGTVPQRQESPGAPISSTIPELPRAAEPPPIPDIEPIESQLRNDNVRDGGLGSLCWARWEINRQLRIGTTSAELAEAQGAVTVLRDELPNIERELDAVREQLPDALYPFLGRLQADVGVARGLLQSESGARAALEAVSQQFSFDSYPEVETYRELATEHPACAHL